MKIEKFIIGIILLSIIACKSSTKSVKLNENPIIQKNPTEYVGMRFPKPLGYINDFEKVFTTEQIQELEKTITAYEKETTREIVIVTINSIKPYENITDFTTDLTNDWAIGKINKKNGLAIVFSKKLRNIRIATGYGTEKILTDEICKKIIDKIIIPEFKDGKYYDGIENGLSELILKWK